MKAFHSLTIFLALSTGLPSTLAAQAGGPNPIPADAETFAWKEVVARSWFEPTASGGERPWMVLSLDGGQSFSRPRTVSFELQLRHGSFDPLKQAPAAAAVGLQARPENELWIVQYRTQGLETYREAIRALGGADLRYLPQNANIWRLTAEQAEQVSELPFVRWIGAFDPVYKLNEELKTQYEFRTLQTDRYNLVVARLGGADHDAIERRLNSIGGAVVAKEPRAYLMEVLLTPAQLAELVHWPEVMALEPWSEPIVFMNHARQVMGADYVESVGGYTGEGVRGEAMDSGLDTAHPDWINPRQPIIHGGNSSWTDHGTAVHGINFAVGGSHVNSRGVVPDAQGIFASFQSMSGGTRYNHTSELVQSPWDCVYQTNSWGQGLGLTYGALAQAMDQFVFDFDLVILQAQGNSSTATAASEAWAKNIVSVGGIQHQDNTNPADDRWNNGASVGPAQDGRIKPDMCAYYHNIWTSDADPGGYASGTFTTGFGGTSGATPITAGHIGLIHQMWHDGLFGNPGGETVFASRPHSTTAKALLINSGNSYPFSGTGHDLTRTHQGWGLPDVRRVYDNRGKTFFVDETDVLQNLQSTSYTVNVAPGESEFRATLVYLDPPGTVSSTQHRINDLSLRVTSPNNTVYWGNNGLLVGNSSTSGGSSNTIDTVENVWVPNPTPGTWTVEVRADSINQDSHTETAGVDADYALVVTPVTPPGCGESNQITIDAPRVANTGSTLTVSYTDAPASTAFEVLYSRKLNGASYQGQCLDIGPKVKQAGSGTTTASGTGSWTSGAIPNKAAGLTVYLEMIAGGDDSNPITLRIQ